jgi:hypothetical protein
MNFISIAPNSFEGPAEAAPTSLHLLLLYTYCSSTPTAPLHLHPPEPTFECTMLASSPLMLPAPPADECLPCCCFPGVVLVVASALEGTVDPTFMLFRSVGPHGTARTSKSLADLSFPGRMIRCNIFEGDFVSSRLKS